MARNRSDYDQSQKSSPAVPEAWNQPELLRHENALIDGLYLRTLPLTSRAFTATVPSATTTHGLRMAFFSLASP